LFSPRFQPHELGAYPYDGRGMDIMREEDDISDMSRRKAVAIDEHEVRDDGERISMNNDNDHTRKESANPNWR